MSTVALDFRPATPPTGRSALRNAATIATHTPGANHDPGNLVRAASKGLPGCPDRGSHPPPPDSAGNRCPDHTKEQRGNVLIVRIAGKDHLIMIDAPKGHPNIAQSRRHKHVSMRTVGTEK